MFVSSILLTNSLQGQISVPRAGYPYCEPFTNSTARPNTVFGGSPTSYLSAATGIDPDGDGVLRLTNAANNQRGYVFIDLPFSFSYGLKFSFEYFAYGGTVSTPADGLSVFLFDGAIDASTFQIGGIGGSLSYAPLVVNDVSPALNQPGLKGAYMGIGFDSFYNWGNNYEGKNGGFLSPTAPGIPLTAPANSEFYQTIAIRGPENPGLPGFNPYQFVVGKRVNNGPELGGEDNPSVIHPNPSDYLYPNVTDSDRRFPINSPSRVEVCTEDGYRKVFVDLRPNGFKSYLLSVYMLVNTASAGLRVEPIVENVPYSFPTTPDNLKLGFAASTGAFNNFHEIRNVVVEVSDLVNIPLPEVENLNAEICIGDENLFEFEVKLESLNSFVQCLQLYNTPPAPPYNVFSTPGPPSVSDCGFNDAVCQEACKSENSLLEIPGKGTFYAVFDDNVDITDEEDRKKAAIRFVPENGFVGEVVAYYQVIDNYGLFSEPKQIRIISNPYPEAMDEGTIDYPACDGQGDGSITGVMVKDLVPGFDYSWTWQSTSGTISNLGKSGASVSFDPATGIGTFSLSGINLGTYTLTVWNPSDSDGCQVLVPIEVNLEDGTPVELDADEVSVCEGTPAILTPFLDPIYNPVPGVNPVFLWYYQNSDRSIPLSNGQTIVINSASVSVAISPSGELTLTGLPPANDTDPETYEFFVEVDKQDNSGIPNAPNFCPFLGDVLASAKITVYPSLEVNASATPDWCRDGSGTITVSALGGNGAKTFTLLDSQGNPVETKSDPSGVTFSGLLPGEYEVEIESNNPTCIESITLTVNGPDEELEISALDNTPTSCEQNNGYFEFEVKGGNGPLIASNISISGGPSSTLTFNEATGIGSFNGLAPNISYTVSITDQQGCDQSVSFTLDKIQLPEFSVSGPSSACESETSLVFSVDYNFFQLQGIAVPTFNWFTQEIGGTPVSSGAGPGGLTFSIDNSSGNLVLTDLKVGSYEFWLEMGGPNSCNLPRKKIELVINPLPITTFEVTDILCFGGTGSITLTSGGQSGYSYSLSNGATNSTGVFSNLPAGDYNLVITNSFGCSQSIDLQISQPDELVVNSTGFSDPTCGRKDGEISFEISGGVPSYQVKVNGLDLIPSNYDFSVSGNVFTIENLAPGTYSVSITDDNGCTTDSDNLFTLSNDDGFQIGSEPIDLQICESGIAIFTPDLTIPPGAVPQLDWYLDSGATQQIASSASPASDGKIYQISSGGVLNISNLTEGSYTYYLKVSGTNICEFITEATVKVISPIEASADSSPVTCFGEANGSITVATPTGGSGVYEFSIDGVTWTSDSVFENLLAGSYTVYVRDDSGDNGCLFEIPNVEVESPSAPITETQGVTLPVSCGLENGAVQDILVTGGWGNYEFEWRKDDPVSGIILSDGTITGIENLAEGNYYLIITDELGCVTIFEYTIGAASDPVYELADPIDACFGTPVRITPIHIAPDPNLPPASATEIRWYKSPNQADLLSDGPDAVNPSITYTIDDSDWLNPALQIDNLPVGTHEFYFYVVCTGQEIRVEVVVYDTPEVVLDSEPVTCFGETNGRIKIVSGDQDEYTYSVNGATAITSTELEALGFTAGIYAIEIFTPAGCPQVLSVEVKGPSGPLDIQLISKVDPSCDQENGQILVRLSGGNPDYILSLNGLAISDFDQTEDGIEVLFEDLPGGNYVFQLTDQEGCDPAQLTVSLTPLEVPGFSVQGDEICAFDPITGVANTGVLSPVVINQAGSTPIYKWYYFNESGVEVLINSGDQLFGGSAIQSPSGELQLSGLASKDLPYKFYLEITGDLVCPGPKIEAEFKVNFTPEVVFEKTDILCFGENTGKIQVESGHLNGFTYTLSNGETNSSGNFENLIAGVYSIEVSNGTSCIQTVQIEIEQPDELKVNAIEFTDPTCDANNGEIVFQPSGGVSPYVISINNQILNSSNFTFSENSGIITVQNLAPGSYSISLTDSNSCLIEEVNLFTLTNNPGISIGANPIDEEFCEGETAILNSGLSVPAGVTPTIRWYRDPEATQEIISSTIPDSEGVVYQINSQRDLIITNLNDGSYTYYMRVSGPGICTEIVKATVSIIAAPEVGVEVNNISCFGEKDGSISVISGHDPTYVYTLSNGASNNSGDFSNLESGVYTLEVENLYGCIQVIDFEILEPKELLLNDLEFINPTCDEDNGSLTFEVQGGTGQYAIQVNGIELNDSNFAYIQSGSVYQVKNLGPGTYSIEVTDENGCRIQESDLFSLINQSGVLIGTTPLAEEIMLGETAVLVPQLAVPAGVDFDLIWYFDSSATQFINSSPTAGSDGVTYQIDGNGTLSVSGLTPGTYTYYYEISGNGVCVTITEAVLVVKSPFTADILTTPVTCFGGSDGTISVENIEGGTLPLGFSLDGIDWQSAPLFENLPVGSYTVFVTDATVTPAVLTRFENIVISTSAQEIISNTPDIIPASCDLSNGAIRNLSLSGGAGGFTGVWRKDDPTSGEVLPTGTLTGLENVFPGTYFLTVTDSNGCIQEFQYVVNELPDPTYQIINPTNICLGESVTLQPVFIAPNPAQPTAATEIKWFKDAGQVGLIANGPDTENATITYLIDDSDWINPKLTITNLPVGTHDFYFFVVCTGQELKVEVRVFDIPQVNFNTVPVICFGDSNGKIEIQSGGSTDYTYSLNGAPAISQQALESLNLAAGPYSLQVLTPAGCAQSVNLTIDGPASTLQLANLVAIDPGCGADNGKIRATITGGWAPYKVSLVKEGTLIDSFTQTEANLELNDLSIGIYTIEITDDKGCKIVSDPIELKDGPTQILVEDQFACEGSVIRLVPRLDPPASSYSVQWYFDEAATQPIVSNPTPNANGITYEIEPNGTLTITGLPYSSNPYEFFASAIGPDVCIGFMAKPKVTIFEIPDPSIVIDDEQCFSEGGLITVNTSGSNLGLQYSLDGVTFQNSNVFKVAPGTYAITVKTSQGCTKVVSDLIVKGPASPIGLENLIKTDATCGQNDGSISFDLIGGYGDFEVDIYLESNLVASVKPDTDNAVTITGLEIGNYSISVRDSGGCTISYTNLIGIEDRPTPINVIDQRICEGQSVTLEPSVPLSSPDITYSWYFDSQASSPIPNGAIGNVTYSISSNGSLTITGLPAKSTSYDFYVKVSGTGICNDTPELAKVIVTEIPNLRVSNPSIVCDPRGTVDLTQYIQGFNPAVYDYNVVSPSGSVLRLDQMTAVNLTGDYRVSSAVKGTNCWNQPQRILVIIASTLLTAEFDYLVDLGGGNIYPNEDVPLGEDVYFQDLSQGNVVKWTWDFGDGSGSTNPNPVHTYNEVGTFKVQLRVLDGIGCESIFEMLVNVIDDFKVIIPNAFTPQGNKNQYFKPEFRGINSIEFYIFNTWGELIYQTNSLEDLGWNGQLNGKDAPNGNYVYRGRFVSRGGKVVEKSGVFILIR